MFNAGFFPFSDAIPSADQIRITPSLKSQRGSVWTKNKSVFENWEVEVTFRVTGRGRIGADGLVYEFDLIYTTNLFSKCESYDLHLILVHRQSGLLKIKAWRVQFLGQLITGMVLAFSLTLLTMMERLVGNFLLQ